MNKVSGVQGKTQLRQGSAADLVLFGVSRCLFLVLQWRVTVLSSCKVHALHGPAAGRLRERGTANSHCPQGLTSTSAPLSHISGAQQQETHPGKIWGAPENQEKYNLLKWRGQARTQQSHLLMGGSVETLTGAVPGGDLQGDRAAKLPYHKWKAQAQTHFFKKFLFLAHLFHFDNWEQQSLWSPCKCLLAPHPCEQWPFLWRWFINADQQQWLKLLYLKSISFQDWDFIKGFNPFSVNKLTIIWKHLLLEKRLNPSNQNMSVEMYTYMDVHVHTEKCLHFVQ